MKIFIDGSAGTTGLVIRERLSGRPDLDISWLPDDLRKNQDARRAALNASDLAILCLPDAASREALSLIENSHLSVLDTSTAHRTADGWTYGFPELSVDQPDRIRAARRVSVPGCHASGFIALIRPLIDAGIIPAEARLSCTSLTGYSGGGRTMIEAYENTGPHAAAADGLSAPGLYGLTQTHKHLPEMQTYAGLLHAPVFQPVAAAFYRGMLVSVPLHENQLNPGFTAADVAARLRETYRGPVIRAVENMDQAGFVYADRLAGYDDMEVTVAGNQSRMLLLAAYDNLGKGASGAAIQCLNLMTGGSMLESLVLDAMQR